MQLALGDFKDSFTVAFNWLMKQQSSVAEGQCLFLPSTYFINGIAGHGPPGTHQCTKIPHSVIKWPRGD